MAKSQSKNLEKSWESRSTDAKARAFATIARMQQEQIAINFNSVHKQSGLSKNYLYCDEEIRKSIEETRESQQQFNKVWHERYEKTSKSKDVVIETKNNRIAKLEEENRKL
ncbi:MAG: DUF6262 family protein, partial [Lachnospiraceae bacterium]